MTRQIRTWPRISIWAAPFGVALLAIPAVGQDAPGDQLFTFGIGQKFGATDNIRLQSSSVGTTYYSDTTFSFGFLNENGPNTMNFYAEGVGRMGNDPIVGTDADFRDPLVDLVYTRETVNSRLNLLAKYNKPDLAFLDPLQRPDIDDQDLYTGGGQLEEIVGGFTLETGLQGPLGFVFDVNTRKRNYVDTTDPLLVPNQTTTAAAGMIFRLSPVMRGRLDVSEKRYKAEDLSGSRTETSRLTFGLDYDVSEIATLGLDLGHSEVVETFDALPGVENTWSGPVAGLTFRRLMPNGEFNVMLDTSLASQGRQSTLSVGRIIDLPTGRFEFSLGVTEGDTFDTRPIGSLGYSVEFPRSAFNVSLSRTASISDTLSQATETTRFDLGYNLALDTVSSLSLDVYYADISLLGAGTGERQRGSLYAYYSRDVTEDWDFSVGYEYRYYNSATSPRANSNGVFFALKRDFKIFR